MISSQSTSSRLGKTLILAFVSMLAISFSKPFLPSIPHYEHYHRIRPQPLHQMSALQRLALERATPDGKIMLYFSNSGFLGQLMNSVCSLQRTGNENFVIAAVDEAMMQECQRLDLPCAPSATGLQKEAQAMDFNSEGYYNIVQMKTSQVEHLMQVGLDVLFSDTDIFYFQDPLKNLPEDDQVFDIAMSTNLVMKTVQWVEGWGNLNSGLYFARSSESMLRRWKSLKRAIAKGAGLEQPPLNKHLCGWKGQYFNQETQVCVNLQNMTTAILDPSKFVIAPSDVLDYVFGEDYFLFKRKPYNLVSIHLACLSGHEKKMRTLEKNGLIAHNSTTFECLDALISA